MRNDRRRSWRKESKNVRRTLMGSKPRVDTYRHLKQPLFNIKSRIPGNPNFGEANGTNVIVKIA
jgi:hypothetical protein